MNFQCTFFYQKIDWISRLKPFFSIWISLAQLSLSLLVYFVNKHSCILWIWIKSIVYFLKICFFVCMEYILSWICHFHLVTLIFFVGHPHPPSPFSVRWLALLLVPNIKQFDSSSNTINLNAWGMYVCLSLKLRVHKKPFWEFRTCSC